MLGRRLPENTRCLSDSGEVYFEGNFSLMCTCAIAGSSHLFNFVGGLSTIQVVVGGKSKKALPTGWERKVCPCCQCTPYNPTLLDTAKGRKLRKWTGISYWGNMCWWCSRFVGIRYAWMSTKRFQEWVKESDEHAKEAMIGIAAYLSLREDGKTHITPQMLEVSAVFRSVPFLSSPPPSSQVKLWSASVWSGPTLRGFGLFVASCFSCGPGWVLFAISPVRNCLAERPGLLSASVWGNLYVFGGQKSFTDLSSAIVGCLGGSGCPEDLSKMWEAKPRTFLSGPPVSPTPGAAPVPQMTDLRSINLTIQGI
jgi:hypothetical protein